MKKHFKVINIHMNAKTTIIKCHEYSENICETLKQQVASIYVSSEKF